MRQQTSAITETRKGNTIINFTGKILYVIQIMESLAHIEKAQGYE